MSKYKEKQIYADWEIIRRFPIVNINNADGWYESLGIVHEMVLEVQCENCKKHTFVKDNIFYQYCPHCGAEMGHIFDPWNKDIITETMCGDYCKWPEKWDAEKEGCELEESEHCKKCPLQHIRHQA